MLAPLVNSYKRLMAGLEAPIYVTWAQLNRGALLRVPRLASQNQPGIGLEMRCTDPSCNPYLAFTVLLHAGLRGIKDGLTLQPAAEEELYEVSNRRRHLTTLPVPPRGAGQFEASELVREALGLHLFERFLEAKRLGGMIICSWSARGSDRYLGIFERRRMTNAALAIILPTPPA